MSNFKVGDRVDIEGRHRGTVVSAPVSFWNQAAHPEDKSGWVETVLIRLDKGFFGVGTEDFIKVMAVHPEALRPE
jgi:hypothetical protein